MLKLEAASEQGVRYLSQRLKPAAQIDPQVIDGLIADLDSEKFAVRQDAFNNLLKVGEQALPALKKALAKQWTLETQRRIQNLYDRLSSGILTDEQIRVVRAVEALERIGIRRRPSSC